MRRGNGGDKLSIKPWWVEPSGHSNQQGPEEREEEEETSTDTHEFATTKFKQRTKKRGQNSLRRKNSKRLKSEGKSVQNIQLSK